MSYRIVDISKLIRVLAATEGRGSGHTIPVLAKLTGLHQSVVRRWLRAMHEQRCVHIVSWRYVVKQWTREWAWGLNEIDAKQPPRLPAQTYRQRSEAKKRLRAKPIERADWAQSLPAGAVFGF